MSLSFKFGKNRVSNNWDFADFEFRAVGGGGGDVQSHFRVKPKLWLG